MTWSLSPAGAIVLRHRLSRVWRLTFAVLFLCASLLRLGMPQLPLARIAVLCLLEMGLITPYRRWFAGGRALGLLLFVQLVTDVLALTLAIAAVPGLPKILHALYLLAIVPAALSSMMTGVAVAALAGLAHVAVVVLDPAGTTGPSWGDLLGPLVVFFLVAQQSLRYGRWLALATHEVETESAVSAALLRVAEELAASSSSASLLQHLSELARDLSGGAWAAVLVRTVENGTYRVAGLASRTGFLDEEIRSVQIDFDAMMPEGAGENGIEIRSAAESFLPAWIHERWRVGPFFTAVLDRRGETLGLLIVGPDDRGVALPPVTRRLVMGMAHEAVLALENARLVENLRAASSLKSEFISTISHELRSPLHAITGYVEMLHEEAACTDVEDRRAMLDRVRIHSLQLLQTIEATLDVNRLDTGRLPVELRPVDIASLLADVDGALLAHWRTPGVALHWRVPGDLPRLETDGPKIKMIVRNLVHNALKFTERGTVTVSARFERDDACEPNAAPSPRLVLAVADTGIGIAPASLPVVFEMFRQGDSSYTRRHEGVGLGLYIVKRLVDALRGTIRVESTEGRGSVFEVIVPVRAEGREAVARSA